MIDQERSEKLKVLLNLTGVDDFANQLKDGSKEVMSSVKDMTKDVSDELNNVYSAAGKGLEALTSDARDKNEGWHGELIKKNASTANEISDTWKTYYKGDLKNLSQYGKGVQKYFNKVNSDAKSFNHWTDIDEARYSDFEKGMFRLTGSIKETKSLMTSLGKGMNLTKFHKAMELAGADSNSTAESLGLLYQKMGSGTAKKAFKQFIRVGGSAVSTAEKLGMFSDSVKAYQEYSEDVLGGKMDGKSFEKYSKTLLKSYKMLRSITGVNADEAKELADGVARFNMLASSPDKVNLLFGENGDKLTDLYTSMGVLKTMYKDQKEFSKDFEKNGVVSVLGNIQKQMGGEGSKQYKDFMAKFFGVVGESFGGDQELFKKILMKNLNETGSALDSWNKAQMKKTESAGKMIGKLAKSYKTGFTAEDVLSKTEEVIENRLIGLTYKDSSRYLKQYTKSLSGFSNELIGVAKNNETYFVGWGVRMASSIKRLGAMGVFAGLRKEAGTTGKTLAMASDMLVDLFTKSHGVLTAMGSLGFRLSDIGKVFAPFTKTMEIANAVTFGTLKPFGKFAGLVGVLSFAVGKLNENMKLTTSNLSGKFTEVTGKISYDILRMTGKNAVINSVGDLKNVLDSNEVKAKLKEVDQVWGSKISDARLGIRKLSSRDKKRIAKNFNIPLQQIDHLVKNNKLMDQINKSIKGRVNTAKVIGKEYIKSVFGGDLSKRSPAIRKRIEAQQKMIISQMGLSMAQLKKEVEKRSKSGDKVTISDLLIEKMNDRSRNILKKRIMGYFTAAKGYMSVGLEIIGKGFNSLYHKMTDVIFGRAGADGKRVGIGLTERLKYGFDYAKSWVTDDKNSNKLSGVLGLALVGGLASKSIRQGFVKSLLSMTKGGLKLAFAPMSLMFGGFFKLLNTKAMIPALAIGGGMAAPFMYKMITGELASKDVSEKVKNSINVINKGIGSVFGKSGGLVSSATIDAAFGNMNQMADVIREKIPFLSKKISGDVTDGVNQSLGSGMSNSGRLAGMGFLGAFTLPLISKEGRSLYGKGLKGMLTSGTKIVSGTGKSMGKHFMGALTGRYGKAGKVASIGVSLFGIGKAFSFFYDLFSGEKNKAIATLASTMNVDASQLTNFFTAKHWETTVIPAIGEGLSKAPGYIIAGISKGFQIARDGMKSYIITLFKEPLKTLGATVTAIAGVGILMKYLKSRNNPDRSFHSTSIRNQATMITHLRSIEGRINGGRSGTSVGGRGQRRGSEVSLNRRSARLARIQMERDMGTRSRMGRMRDSITGGAKKVRRGGSRVIGSVKKFGKLGAATAIFGLAGAASGINDLIKGEKGLGESMWNVAKGIASIHPIGLVISEGAELLYNYFKEADKISAAQLDEKIAKDESLRKKFIQIDREFADLASSGVGKRKKKMQLVTRKLVKEVDNQNVTDDERVKAVIQQMFSGKNLKNKGVNAMDIFDITEELGYKHKVKAWESMVKINHGEQKIDKLTKERENLDIGRYGSDNRRKTLLHRILKIDADTQKYRLIMAEEEKKEKAITDKIVKELAGDSGLKILGSLKSVDEVATFMTRFSTQFGGTSSLLDISKNLSQFNFKSLESFGSVISVFEKDKRVKEQFSENQKSFFSGVSQVSDRMIESMSSDKGLGQEQLKLMSEKMLSSVTGADKDFMTFASRLDDMPKLINDSVKGLGNLDEFDKGMVKESLKDSYMVMIKQATGMSFDTIESAQAYISTMGDSELRKMKEKFKSSIDGLGVLDMDKTLNSAQYTLDNSGKSAWEKFKSGYDESKGIDLGSDKVNKALDMAYSIGTKDDLKKYQQIIFARGNHFIEGLDDASAGTRQATDFFITKFLNSGENEATLGILDFDRNIDLAKGSTEAKMNALLQFTDSARASVFRLSQTSSEQAKVMQDNILSSVRENLTQMNVSGEVTMENLKQKLASLPESQQAALYNSLVISSEQFNSLAKNAITTQRNMANQTAKGFGAFLGNQLTNLSSFFDKLGFKALRTKSSMSLKGASNISSSDALDVTKKALQGKSGKKLSKSYQVNIENLSEKAQANLMGRKQVITSEAMNKEVSLMVAKYLRGGITSEDASILKKKKRYSKSELKQIYTNLGNQTLVKEFQSRIGKDNILDLGKVNKFARTKVTDADSLSQKFSDSGITDSRIKRMISDRSEGGLTIGELQAVLSASKKSKDYDKFLDIVKGFKKDAYEISDKKNKEKDESDDKPGLKKPGLKKPGLTPRNNRSSYDRDSSGGYVQALFNSNREEETKKILEDSGLAAQTTARTIRQIYKILDDLIKGNVKVPGSQNGVRPKPVMFTTN